MRFQESGLQNDKLVEDAFNYGAAYAQSLSSEAMMNFKQQIDAYYAQNLQAMTAAKNAQKLTEADFTREKTELDRVRAAQMGMGPRVVADALNDRFTKQSIAPAMEIQSYSDKASPELIAAVLLAGCVRSPVDYKNVAEKFGDTIANLVAEVVHINAYPGAREANLAAASGDAKRVNMAILTASLESIVGQSQKQLQTGQKLAFPPGQEESLFANAKLLWGADKKLDKRLLDTFNRAAQVTSSVFRMEADAKGTLELVKGGGQQIKPRPIGRPKIGGDEVF